MALRPLLYPALLLCAAAQPLLNFTRQQRTVLPWLTPLQTFPTTDPAALAAACLNSSAAPPPPCTWSAAKANYYLPGCASPSAASVNCIHYDTLAQAQAACAADADCGGLTSQDGGVPPWELRRGPALTYSALGEVSYAILNPQACHAPSAACNAFATDGSLYHCPGGRCDCDAGASACARGRDIFSTDPAIAFGAATTDLYVLAGQPPPAEWQAAIAAGTLLYASPEPPPCYWPEVGNGYVATVPGWASMHVGGLFNGACGSTTKARLPSPVALSLVGARVIRGALDTLNGALLRQWLLEDGVTIVTARTWAHRTRPHVLVVDLELRSGGSGAAAFNLTSLWNPAEQGGGGGWGMAARATSPWILTLGSRRALRQQCGLASQQGPATRGSAPMYPLPWTLCQQACSSPAPPPARASWLPWQPPLTTLAAPPPLPLWLQLPQAFTQRLLR